jgi:cell division protein FtsI (penicillin-binding protein 3)
MAVDDKNISYRILLLLILLMALAIAFKLTNIQWVEGSYYRQLAKGKNGKLCYSTIKVMSTHLMEVY